MELKWNEQTLADIHPCNGEDNYLEPISKGEVIRCDSIEPVVGEEDNLMLNIFNEVMIIVPKNSFTFC